MEALFFHLNLLIWLEDLLGSAQGADNLIETLKSVLAIRREKSSKLNLCKCDLIATKVEFCGRWINAKGVTVPVHHYEAVMSMEAPTTAGALMELVHSANRIRTAIPRFSGRSIRLLSHTSFRR